MLDPRPDLRQRLVFALIGEVSFARSQDLAHASAIARTNGAKASIRDTCRSRVIFFIDQPCAWNARRTRVIVSTLFNSHSIRCPKTNGQTKPEGGQNWMPITPPSGSILHAETQARPDVIAGLATFRSHCKPLTKGFYPRHIPKCDIGRCRISNPAVDFQQFCFSLDAEDDLAFPHCSAALRSRWRARRRC